MGTRDAASFLGLSQSYFRQLVFEGKIPYHKSLSGGRNVYLRADLERYRERLTTPGVRMITTEEALDEAAERDFRIRHGMPLT